MLVLFLCPKSSTIYPYYFLGFVLSEILCFLLGKIYVGRILAGNPIHFIWYLNLSWGLRLVLSF